MKKLQDNLEKKNNNKCKIIFQSGDLTKISDVKKIINSVRKNFKTIDILINNAGIFLSKPILKSDINEFQNIFDVNVKAPFLFCKEFSRDMKEKKWGRIINIGSSSSYQGFSEGTIYCSSKHALLGLSRSLFAELKESKIRVFSISPGSIKTKMGKQDKKQNYKTFLDPKEVAEYIVYSINFDKELVSEEIRLNRFTM
ncbi:SDR family NAD(P)-dependent oxidoreductase [Candidatus Nitrosarchaeum limnium]|nr:SDR family oxidoreductase [Candidatus Nitrosarchaeum limnium]